jgi:chemotaxis protein MotB
MGSPSAPSPIIVVRKRKGHGGHHGGAWKVAYADFVTAMMALFMVLWLLSSSEKVKKAVGGYFQDPTGSGKMAGSTMAGAGEALTVAKDDMTKLKDRLEQAMRELPKFEQMKDNVEVTVTNEGLRIELLEKEGGLFFENGSPKPLDKGNELIRMMGEQLKSVPNKLSIEGHTDSKPYASDAGYTNWELSADRANSARRILQEAGVDGAHIAQIRGFADQHLRDTKEPLNPMNRRVSVLVQYREPAVDAAAPATAPKSGH